MNITTVGIDLAKLLFQVHGADARGKVVLRKQFKRSQVVTFFSQLAPCLIGMEACGSAHFWARKLMEFGHTVKLIAPQFVLGRACKTVRCYAQTALYVRFFCTKSQTIVSTIRAIR